MKKVFKRFIAFAFATALLLAPLSTPITTYAANFSPVLEYENYYPDEGFSKGYKFETPYTVAPGESVVLADVAGFLNGQWTVPPSKDFFIYANFTGMSKILIDVIEMPSGNIVYSTTEQNLSFYLTVPANNLYTKYYVRVINIGSETIGVENYAAMTISH